MLAASMISSSYSGKVSVIAINRFGELEAGVSRRPRAAVTSTQLRRPAILPTEKERGAREGERLAARRTVELQAASHHQAPLLRRWGRKAENNDTRWQGAEKGVRQGISGRGTLGRQDAPQLDGRAQELRRWCRSTGSMGAQGGSALAWCLAGVCGNCW